MMENFRYFFFKEEKSLENTLHKELEMYNLAQILLCSQICNDKHVMYLYLVHL